MNISPKVVRFIAIECELQMSGERSVSWMVDAWLYAQAASDLASRPVVQDVINLGQLVEPFKNANGFRQVGVRVGGNIKIPWEQVSRQMVLLMENQNSLTPEEFYYEYEEIHPFRDGNGRTGVLLYNWLNKTLEDPVWPPNFWGDHRRTSGNGAP